jgi:hypothetical protein
MHRGLRSNELYKHIKQGKDREGMVFTELRMYGTSMEKWFSGVTKKQRSRVWVGVEIDVLEAACIDWGSS